MFVCCVLAWRGRCDGLITRLDDSYRLWCVAVCDPETSRMRRPLPVLGRNTIQEKNSNIFLFIHNKISNCFSRLAFFKEAYWE